MQHFWHVTEFYVKPNNTKYIANIQGEISGIAPINIVKMWLGKSMKFGSIGFKFRTIPIIP